MGALGAGQAGDPHRGLLLFWMTRSKLSGLGGSWIVLMRRTVVIKGIAGLGNRLQVLGHCCDLASRWNAALCVDWTHNSWSDSFENYFQLSCPSETAFVRPEGGFGQVMPSRYACCITKNPLNCHGSLNGDFLTETDPDPDGPWDSLVVCGYLARYSNRLFRILRLNQDIKQVVMGRMNELNLIPGAYDCWHVRHTDASGGCPDEILRAIARHSSTRRKVVITDSFEVVEMCRKLSIVCPSVIPSIKGGSRVGVHHLGEERLLQEGLAKQDVNRAVVTDLMIAGLARHFWGTCQRSTFSDFIYRVRIVSWFECAVLGRRLNLFAWGNPHFAHFLQRCYLSYKTRRGRLHGWILA
jgi:hypothetical protein